MDRDELPESHGRPGQMEGNRSAVTSGAPTTGAVMGSMTDDDKG